MRDFISICESSDIKKGSDITSIIAASDKIIVLELGKNVIVNTDIAHVTITENHISPCGEDSLLKATFLKVSRERWSKKAVIKAIWMLPAPYISGFTILAITTPKLKFKIFINNWKLTRICMLRRPFVNSDINIILCKKYYFYMLFLVLKYSQFG